MTNMLRRMMVVLVGAPLLAVVAATPAMAAPPDEADFVEAGFERDVFVVVGSTLRNPDASTDPSEPLFNVAGIGLGVTWGDWQAGGGSSTARTTGNATDFRLELTGLVPNGVYSVFYATIGPDSEHPLCQGGIERSLPLTAFHEDRQLPDASSFVASPDGTTSYRGKVDGAVLDATQVFLSVIYHADGGTYHPFPNKGEYLTHDGGNGCRSSYGHDAMRQFLILQKW